LELPPEAISVTQGKSQDKTGEEGDTFRVRSTLSQILKTIEVETGAPAIAEACPGKAAKPSSINV